MLFAVEGLMMAVSLLRLMGVKSPASLIIRQPQSIEMVAQAPIDRDRNRLIINFTGTDCDGFHDNGTITWQLDK